jgi:hypothetical protein
MPVTYCTWCQSVAHLFKAKGALSQGSNIYAHIHAAHDVMIGQSATSITRAAASASRGIFMAKLLFSSSVRGFLMTHSTCATNPAGMGVLVLTWMQYWASFSRASSVLAVRGGEAGRDRGGMLAGNSNRYRRSRFSHVSGREGSVCTLTLRH